MYNTNVNQMLVYKHYVFFNSQLLILLIYLKCILHTLFTLLCFTWKKFTSNLRTHILSGIYLTIGIFEIIIKFNK